MKYQITIVGDTADDLLQNLSNLAAAMADQSTAEPVKRGPGRPRKIIESEPTVQAPVAPIVAVPPAVATPVAPVEAASVVPAETTKVYTKGEVQSKLIEVVTKVSKDACAALCAAHGGANLSAIDPSNYPALYADAVKLLAS